jgi:hypothetical protein
MQNMACNIFNLWTLLGNIFRDSFRSLVLWRISTSYMNFFMQSLVFFFIYVLLFSVLIYWTISAAFNKHGELCANTNQEWFYNETHNKVRHNMEIAFELSWITFTTVGYGNVAPSSSSTGCYVLRYLCAFEAFVGIVFFSLLGAIFFTKIGLTFGEAPITFSRALCVKKHGNSNEFVLEMQIVHDKANRGGGHEILRATLQCIVAVDVSDTNQSSDSISEVHSRGRPTLARSNQLPSFYLYPRSPKQTCYTIKLEGGEHPYFNRVWHCHHILNGDSPLVKKNIQFIDNVNDIRGALVPFHTMVCVSTVTLFLFWECFNVFSSLYLRTLFSALRL